MLSEENNIRNKSPNVQKLKELEIQIIAKKIMFDFDLNVIERLFFFILLKSPHDVTQILSRRNWVIEYFHFTVLMFTFSLFPLNSLDRLNNYDEFFRFSMPRPTSAFTFLDHKYSERI